MRPTATELLQDKFFKVTCSVFHGRMFVMWVSMIRFITESLQKRLLWRGFVKQFGGQDKSFLVQ
jgi:hypothetical protein